MDNLVRGCRVRAVLPKTVPASDPSPFHYACVDPLHQITVKHKHYLLPLVRSVHVTSVLSAVSPYHDVTIPPVPATWCPSLSNAL